MSNWTGLTVETLHYKTKNLTDGGKEGGKESDRKTKRDMWEYWLKTINK